MKQKLVNLSQGKEGKRNQKQSESVHACLISQGQEIGWGLSCMLCIQHLAQRGARCRQKMPEESGLNFISCCSHFSDDLRKCNADGHEESSSGVSLWLPKMKKNLSWQDFLCSVPDKYRVHSHSSRVRIWGRKKEVFSIGKILTLPAKSVTVLGLGM